MKKVNLSKESRLSEIFAHESSREVFDKYLPGVREGLEGQKAVLGFSLAKLFAFGQGRFPEGLLDIMDGELAALKICEEDTEGDFTADYPLTKDGAEIIKEPPKDAVYPGKVWRDTSGRRIQAHGGSLFYEDRTYYWYGEDKMRTDGICPVWSWGIRAYKSADLYNWEDIGTIIEPDLENPESGLYPAKHVDRPHIKKCAATGKYVCWIKQSGEEACFVILTADKFTGPYTQVRENYRPFGYHVGDFDIYAEDETGEAYLFMTADHLGIFCFRLSDDYTQADAIVSKQYEGLNPPFCPEGPAVFKYKEKYYLLTSGMTGYIPNKSDSAVSPSLKEPFKSIGNPHVNDVSDASFNSQISQVFKVPGKESLYIALADRWVPDYPIDAKLADIFMRSAASHYEPEKYQVTDEERAIVMNSPMLDSANTSRSDYVWLPLRFEDEKVCIDWKDSWRAEDYE